MGSHLLSHVQGSDLLEHKVTSQLHAAWQCILCNLPCREAAVLHLKGSVCLSGNAAICQSPALAPVSLHPKRCSPADSSSGLCRTLLPCTAAAHP